MPSPELQALQERLKRALEAAFLAQNKPVKVVIEESPKLKRMGINEVLFELTKNWAVFVGNSLHLHSSPTAYDANKKELRIRVDQGVYHQELQMRIKVIMDIVNDQYGKVMIESVKLRVF